MIEENFDGGTIDETVDRVKDVKPLQASNSGEPLPLLHCIIKRENYSGTQ